MADKKMGLEYYLNLFKALLIKTHFSTGIDRDKTIPIALVIMQELSKDRRVEDMKAEREKQKQEPATARQIAYLRILGKETEHGITKQQAAKMIEEVLSRR